MYNIIPLKNGGKECRGTPNLSSQTISPREVCGLGQCANNAYDHNSQSSESHLAASVQETSTHMKVSGHVSANSKRK